MDLELENSGFLNSSFDGRSFTAWINPENEIYSGPAVTKHESIVAYFPADEGTGTSTNDISIRQSPATFENGVSWSAGRFGQALSMDGEDDYVSIKTSSSLNDLHHSSYSLSMWLNPAQPAPGMRVQDQLRIHGFNLIMSLSLIHI